ncbi:MAG: hypothetical protein GW941_02670 [Candidatus Pacebacteria bacterium]|nr:hypothetical protein [Candidatus Paceibacterota bacterium]
MQKLNKSNSILTKLFFSFWFIYFLIFWSKALFFDQAGNLVAGHVNIWGDWAAHFTMGSAMANRGLILDSSPFLINAKFSYPFVADLISAIFLKISGNFIYSFIVPSFLLSIFFVWAIFYFFKTLWQSEKKAILSSLIFMFNGGLGFYFYLKEVVAIKNPLLALINPVHEVTRYDLYSIKWINVIDSMIIPQRSFLLGFPLTVLALTIIYKNFFQNKKVNLKQTLISGIILGLMPIIHTHSFLAAFIILAFWSFDDILNKSRIQFKNFKIKYWPHDRLINWGYLLLTTGLISLPLIFYYFLGNVNHEFSKFYPGWLAKSYQMNWFEFWWRNWFLVPWLSIFGFLLMAKKERKKTFIFSPFIFIFIVANLYLFQPFAWDNTKLFIWSSLGFSYLTVYTLDLILKKKWNSSFTKNIIKLFIGSSFFLIILSGLMDSYYIIRHDLHSHIMYKKEEIDLANWLKSETEPEAIWLTGDKHNHFVFNLTGRQTILTYRGWLWTHGYDYKPVEKEVLEIFSDPIKHLDLLKKYNIKYIVIGINEKTVWKADEEQFMISFPLIKQTNNYKIFKNEYN